MTFDAFLSENRRTLLSYYALEQWLGERIQIETPYPPAILEDDELEALRSRLCKTMPRQSMMLDLWDWDLHFEEDLENDWFFEAAFGPDSSAEDCAETLADYFLEKAAEYAMDYDQCSSDDFDALVQEEALQFINSWRNNLDAVFMVAKGSNPEALS